MPPLTDDRNTPELGYGSMTGLLGASQTIFAGALLMRNAAGHIIRGATATGAVGVGRAEERKTSTSAGVTGIVYRPGTFRYANSASADEITAADIGRACWIVDDETVARTNGSNTRSKAGTVVAVEPLGVWVRFDEALTNAT
jgi:hypothetical protein